MTYVYANVRPMFIITQNYSPIKSNSRTGLKIEIARYENKRTKDTTYIFVTMELLTKLTLTNEISLSKKK